MCVFKRPFQQVNIQYMSFVPVFFGESLKSVAFAPLWDQAPKWQLLSVKMATKRQMAEHNFESKTVLNAAELLVKPV